MRYWSSGKRNPPPEPKANITDLGQGAHRSTVDVGTDAPVWFIVGLIVMAGILLGGLTYPAYEHYATARIAQAAPDPAAVEFATRRSVDWELGVACYTVYSSDGQLTQSCVNINDSCYWYAPKKGQGHARAYRKIYGAEPIDADLGFGGNTPPDNAGR